MIISSLSISGFKFLYNTFHFPFVCTIHLKPSFHGLYFKCDNFLYFLQFYQYSRFRFNVAGTD